MPDVETAQGVAFGEARVVGRYDGTTFTLTEPPSAPMMPVEPDGGTGADPYAPLATTPSVEETEHRRGP